MFANQVAVPAAAFSIRSRHARVRRAVKPVLEALENRRLMSASIALTNLDGVPFNDRLIFNKVQIPDANIANVTHDKASLQISNTGDSALNISAITPTGPWVLLNAPTFPLSIAAGGSTTITVQFTQSTLPRHVGNQTNFTTNVNGGATITGSLRIQSDDPAHATSTVALAGYWQSKSESNAEPGLATIVNLVSGYTTNIGGSPNLPEPSGANRKGDEVLSNAWEAANPNSPVTVRQLAGFHTQGNIVHTFWFTGDTSGTVSHQLFSSLKSEGQSLLPHSASNAPASSSFRPGGAFGFRVDNEFSLDALNNTAGGGHHFRFYPLIDRSGAIVANTWIVAMDYAVIQTENFDFQDNVYIVGNMQPAQSQPTLTVPPAPTNLTATNVAHPVLNWTGITYANAFNYNIYRSTSVNGTFTLLNTVNSSTTTFTDNTAPSGALFYRVTAIDTTTSNESAPATASANVPTAPTAIADSFDTTTDVAKVVDVTANDQGLDATRIVTIVVNGTHGTADVDPQTGLVNYTPDAGFAGVDTFTYHVSNGTQTSNDATVTFNVSQPIVTPALPIAGDETVFELAGPSFNIVPSNVTDAEGNPLSASDITAITIVTAPTKGDITLSGSTIVYTPKDTVGGANFVGNDSFTYNVTDDQGHTSTNTGTISLEVGVQFGSGTGHRSMTYADASGTSPTATLNLGQASAFFTGTGIFTVDSIGRITVGPISGASNLKLGNIALVNTNGVSTLAILTPRNRGSFTFGGVSDVGTLGRIVAPKGTLDGSLVPNQTRTINVGGLAVLQVNTVSNAIIDIGTGFAAGPAVVAGLVNDSSLNATGAVRFIKAINWVNTEGGSPGVTATSLGTLLITGTTSVSGDFEPNLNLTGALGVASIAGTLAKGGWDITGNARVIVTHAVTNTWSGAVLGTLNAMVVRTGGMPAPIQGGVLNILNVVSGDLSGSIDVASARIIRAAGAISSRITATGDIFAIVGGSMNGARVTAGDVTKDFADATAVTDLGSNKITIVRLTSAAANAFSNSTIMARTITTSILGAIDTNTDGGLAAGTFSNVSLKVGATPLHLGPAQLATPGDITAINGVDLGDFRIRVLG